jgi:tRNA modification GTPase
LLNGPLSPEPHAQPGLLVITKCDLGIAPPLALPSETSAACSSATGAGIWELAAAIRQRVAALPVEPRGDAAAARCQGSLDEAARALTAAQQLAASAGNEELLAAEIRAALDAVGVVVGAVCTDDVLDRVFSQFCIGK